MNFDNCKKLKKGYGGKNGNKKCIEIDGKRYMLKQPPTINKIAHRGENNCFSEHIACKIYNLIGIKAQETILGTYTKNGEKVICVACKDFTENGKYTLEEFYKTKNGVESCSSSGMGADIEDIKKAILEQENIDAKILLDYFYDMFVVDALIANPDRHNENWGLLYNDLENEYLIAPIYDCGNSLYSLIDDEMIDNILNDKNDLNNRIYEYVTSIITKGEKRLNYFDYISSLENNDLNEAVLRIVPKINMDAISDMIDREGYISDIRKKFYKIMLKERKIKILDFAYNKIILKKSNINKS